jgi:hypothetical protein
MRGAPLSPDAIISSMGIPLARESLRTHRAFENFGVEIDAAVVGEAGQTFPVLERITDGLSDWGFGCDAAEQEAAPDKAARRADANWMADGECREQA